MAWATKLILSFNPPAIINHRCSSVLTWRSNDFRPPFRSLTSSSCVRLECVSTGSDPSISSSPSSENYTATVGVSPSHPVISSQWRNLTQRNITVLNVIACMTAVSATWLFLCAIPTLLAFKRAAESLSKLMDVTREELPSTMAAIRLSGMELSDLTMELSDLGQGITRGVKSSTKAVRMAEERLRQLTTMAPTAFVQIVSSPKIDSKGPAFARTAREIKDGIVKGRAVFHMFFTITRFSRVALNYFANRPRH